MKVFKHVLEDLQYFSLEVGVSNLQSSCNKSGEPQFSFLHISSSSSRIVLVVFRERKLYLRNTSWTKSLLFVTRGRKKNTDSQ